MFAGHAALALLGKGARQRIPYLVLLGSAFAPDVIQRALMMTGSDGREASHSILSIGIGATLVALGYWMWSRKADDALIVWLAYALHWPADYITGLKPTWPNGPNVGMMLYFRPPRDAVLECDLILLCWLGYRSTLEPAKKFSTTTLVIPVALILLQLGFDFGLAPLLDRL